MVTENLTRWMLGYVRFTASGGSPERFLNLAAHAGIRLWGMQKQEGRLTASVHVRAYRALWPLARKCGTRLRITRKRGIPFGIHRCRNRKGLALGVVLFAAIYYVLSLYVWTVEVHGTAALDPTDVLAAAEERGLYVGCLKSGVDPAALSKELMLALPETGWVAVNTMGSTVSIELREKIQTPEIADEKTPGNVVASDAGQVIRMEVFGGEAAVKVGDAVTQGDLLIRGVVEDAEGAVRLQHAAGIVTAETRRTLTAEIQKQQLLWEPTGKVVWRCSTRIFGAQIPLTFVGIPKGPYRRETAKSPFMLGDVTLPISIFTEKWSELAQREVTLSEAEAKAAAETELRRMEEETFPKANIRTRETQFSFQDGTYRLTGSYVCEENIAVETPLFSQEVPKQESPPAE